jgi:ubiquitin-conjugating enzyme E2 Q
MSDSDDMKTEYFDEDDFMDDASVTGNTRSASQPEENPPEPEIPGKDRIMPDHCLWSFLCDNPEADSNGFRIGYYGNFWIDDTIYVSVSVHIHKLGISEAAMQAWDLDPNRYFVLLIRYDEGYRSMYFALNEPERLSFRVGTSKTYKPSYEDVSFAFSPRNGKDKTTDVDDWKPTFISRPLDELFNRRFMCILRHRIHGMSWTGAERFFHERQGAVDNSEPIPEEYMEPDEPASGYASIIADDHVENYVHAHPDPTAENENCSFPVVAMQFALRHFVRCTEFCLVCHRKLQYQLEAIKPYVCDTPLCLFQYMTFNFGPSLEHEIVTQPYVVDLLISFCYNAVAENEVKKTFNIAVESELKKFPTGLNLRVPALSDEDPKQTANLSTNTMCLRFNDTQHGLAVGDWVAIQLSGRLISYHHRVEETRKCVVALSPHGLTSPLMGENTTQFTEAFVDVEVKKYSVKFDEMSDYDRRETIREQLGLLPSVKEMAEFLAVPGREISSWKQRITPAGLSILRWIVASNRSCILQVEEKDKIHGLDSYMQFRFAMGSPVRSSHHQPHQRVTTSLLYWFFDRIRLFGVILTIRLTYAGQGEKVPQRGQKGRRPPQIQPPYALRMAWKPLAQLAHDHS